MDIDELFKEDITIEEIPDEVKKEDINVGVTKGINYSSGFYYYSGGTNNKSSLKQFIIDYYSSGDSLNATEITNCGGTWNSGYWSISVYFRGQNELLANFTIESSVITAGEDVRINGYDYKKIQLLESSEDCCGLNFYTRSYYNPNVNQMMFEIVPREIVSSGDSPSISVNQIDYTEYLQTIIERLEGIEEDVQNISGNIVSSGNGSNNNNNSQVSSVSQNIITTPINEYGLTDSLLFIGFGIAFIALLIVVVRRLIYKWS